MRRYDIVTGILLILSIIDFALAAPVLGQEKHEARADMVHMPKDVTTVLGKRWEEELENLGEEYFKTSGKLLDSSGTHSPSSTAPSGPDHGSTNLGQPPASNLASSAANPDLLRESSCSPSCSLSTSSMKGLAARGPGSCFRCLRLFEEFANGVLLGLFGDRLRVHGYEPSDYSSDSDYELYVPRPNPNTPNLRPSADPNFDWDNWRNAEDPPRSKLASSEEDSEEGSQSRGGSSPPDYEATPGPPSSPNHQSSSSASRPVNLLAAISAVKGKGKAKEYEYISFHPVSDESDDSD